MSGQLPIPLSTDAEAKAAKATRTKTVREQLRNIGIYVALGLTFVVGIVLLFISALPSVQGNTFWTTLLETGGVSAIASAIIWLAQTLFVSRAQDQVLREAVEREVKKLQEAHHLLLSEVLGDFSLKGRNERAEIISILNTSEPRFKPSRIYRDVQGADPDFNRDLHSDLNDTVRYLFRGVGGAETAVRLSKGAPLLQKVDILLPDPRARVFEDRFRYERKLDRNDKLTSPELRAIMLERIAQAVVGLYEARDRAKFRVHFVTSDFNHRFEICDRAAYVTPYIIASDGSAGKGETLRFEKFSFNYGVLLTAARDAGTTPTVLELNKGFTEPRLKDELVKLQLLDEQADLADLFDRFKNFRRDKADKLEQLRALA